MTHVLLIDDDSKLRTMVCEYLQTHGHSVQQASNSQEGDQLLNEQQFELLILDINMPGEDGLSLLKRLRARQCHMPVLILSGRGHELDRIRGLDIGADDYLVKPFSPRELLSRVQALLRRARLFTPPPAELNFGNFRYDAAQLALYENGTEVQLSSGERALLKAFADNPGRTLSRQMLLSILGDEFGENFERSIDVRVTRLRARLKENAEAPRFIHTIRGQGYCFLPHGDTKS